MSYTEINGLDYANMVSFGMKRLVGDIDRINSLNVFPVPDGDTGTNMRMTIEGGVKEGLANKETSIGKQAKVMARSMTMNARGNSGVILSQFFSGISRGLGDTEVASVEVFANALVSGYQRSYKVVQNPTEGTILTVMREAADESLKSLKPDMTLNQYLEIYLDNAKASLERTPDLLPVLKKAGVIDSGGAGLVLIIDGMIKYLNGEEIEDVEESEAFGPNSKLEYGYHLEFSLQLQNSKVNIELYNIEDTISYLHGIGTNVKAQQNGTEIDISLNTFNPGQVLVEMRKIGEFIDIKIANIDISKERGETVDYEESAPQERKKYATVAVANGSGLVKAFKEMGVDEVVSGGQTMNTSTKDFIKAFDKLNAENILVLPNNGNIIMAAKQAAENYSAANVYVVPTKTLAQGYSAVGMLNFDSNDTEQILEETNEVISNVNTLEVTYSVRDCVIDNVDVKKGDYICIYNGNLIASDINRVSALKKALRSIPNIEDMAVMTAICGVDVSIEEADSLSSLAQAFNPYLEVYSIEGNQDIYSYIIGLE